MSMIAPQDSGVIAGREWRRVHFPLLLLDALRPASRTARPRTEIVPVAEVRRVASLLLQLQLLLVVSEVISCVTQQTGEVRYALPLRGDLSHEAADLLEVRIVGSRKLTVIPRSDLIQYRRPVRVVLLEMTIQVGLLAEASFAKRALERLLLVVDVSDVTLEVAGDAETPLAVLALIRLFASVRPQVSCQIR